MHFGCSKRGICRKLALNPVFKKMQIQGLHGHRMNDKTFNPLGLSLGEVLELGVELRYSSEVDAMYATNPHWTFGDVLKAYFESVSSLGNKGDRVTPKAQN